MLGVGLFLFGLGVILVIVAPIILAVISAALGAR